MILNKKNISSAAIVAIFLITEVGYLTNFLIYAQRYNFNISSIDIVVNVYNRMIGNVFFYSILSYRTYRIICKWFRYEIILRTGRKIDVYKRQLKLVLREGLLYVSIMYIFIVVASVLSVENINNWNSYKSYFFSTTKNTLDINSATVLAALLIGFLLWMVMVETYNLLIFWLLGDGIKEVLISLVSGIFLSKILGKIIVPLIGYKDFINGTGDIIKSNMRYVVCLLLIVAVNIIVTRFKQFYKNVN